MSFNKKAQYFRMIQAKKKTKVKKDDTSDKHQKQKSISSYFAKSVTTKEEDKSFSRSESSDENLKRKLESFKHDELTVDDYLNNSSAPQPLVNSPKKSRIESVKNQDQAEKSGATTSSIIKTNSNIKKLTPLEQQVKALKEKYQGTLLMVECGYRYRFFGQDAEKAAKILDIIAHPDSVGSGLLGLTASVPTFNGPRNYVRKLVLHGEKVGIVSQTESSAEKKVNSSSNSSSGPFSRDLTEVYTISTFLDDVFDENAKTFSILTCFKTAALAITPATGHLVLNKINDNGLKDLLYDLEPIEIITDDIENNEIIANYVHDQRILHGNPVRLELLQFSKEDLDQLEHMIMNENEEEENSNELSSNKLKQAWPGFNRDQLTVFQFMFSYLKQFSLGKNLILNSNFDLLNVINTSSVLKIPPMTLQNLELNNNKSGSLLPMLNIAKTKPGRRLFKFWLNHPITIKSELEKRLDSVEFLRMSSSGGPTSILTKLRSVLTKNQWDFEIMLTSAMNFRITMSKFKLFLSTMASISTSLAAIVSSSEVSIDQETVLPKFLQNILDQIIINFSIIPTELLQPLQNDIVINEVTEGLNSEIQTILEELENHKKEICKTLGLLTFEYTTVSGLDYLIEVKLGNSVPLTWNKINATQKVGRYRTPFIQDRLPKIQFLKEKLEVEAKKSWTAYLTNITSRLKCLLNVSKNWATLDVLVSLALISQREGFVRPKFDSSAEEFKVLNNRNLVIENSLVDQPGCQYVSNDIDLKSGQVLVLTGPNMGGKSCYLRQVATTVILAQMGSFVPASEAILPIFDAIYLRMGARDELFHGKSTLFVELEETSLILNNATSKSLVLLDELGRGTATHDGTAIAQAVVQHLKNKIHCRTMFVTHFKSIIGDINAHMGFLSGEEVLFLYKLQQGQCSSSFGVNVAKLAEMPEPILQRAIDIARCFETLHQGALEEHQTKKPHQQVLQQNPNNVNNPPSKNCEL